MPPQVKPQPKGVTSGAWFRGNGRRRNRYSVISHGKLSYVLLGWLAVNAAVVTALLSRRPRPHLRRRLFRWVWALMQNRTDPSARPVGSDPRRRVAPRGDRSRKYVAPYRYRRKVPSFGWTEHCAAAALDIRHTRFGASLRHTRLGASRRRSQAQRTIPDGSMRIILSNRSMSCFLEFKASTVARLAPRSIGRSIGCANPLDPP